MAKKTKSGATIYVASRGEIMREAWKIARQLASTVGKQEGMPSNPRDYLSVTLKKSWKRAVKVVMEKSDMGILKYDSTDDVMENLITSAHDKSTGSSKFWLVNRGAGKAGDDDLDVSVYNTEWVDAEDYTVAEVMTDLSKDGFFGEGYAYNPITDQVESTEIQTVDNPLELTAEDIWYLLTKKK